MREFTDRYGIMRVHSVIWNQFQAPIHRDMFLWAWRHTDANFRDDELISEPTPSMVDETQFDDERLSRASLSRALDQRRRMREGTVNWIHNHLTPYFAMIVSELTRRIAGQANEIANISRRIGIISLRAVAASRELQHVRDELVREQQLRLRRENEYVSYRRNNRHNIANVIDNALEILGDDKPQIREMRARISGFRSQVINNNTNNNSADYNNNDNNDYEIIIFLSTIFKSWNIAYVAIIQCQSPSL